MPLNIGITGHRKLENPEILRHKMRHAIEAILNSCGELNFVAYSCLASGSDSIFAEIALEMGAKLKVVLPIPFEEYKKDFDLNELELLNRLIALDPDPDVICHEVSQKNDNRNEAYLNAGQKVVDKCNVLIAVWDGEEGSGKGGTADIVTYARRCKKKVIYIHAWRSDVSKLFIKYDREAILFKRRYDLLWKCSIFLTLAAALILAISLSFKFTYEYEVVLAAAEFGSILIAICVIFYLKWGKLNSTRIALRRSAERLRVISKFDEAGISIGQLEAFDGLPPEVSEIERKYEQVKYSRSNFEENRQNVLCLVEEQLIYHAFGRAERRSGTFHYLEKAQFSLLFIFVAGVIMHFAAVMIHDDSRLYSILHALGYLLSLSIPPVYAAIEGYIYFKEYHKILNDSKKMVAFFDSAKKALIEIAYLDFDMLDSYSYQILKNMDAENKEWSVLIGRPRSPGI